MPEPLIAQGIALDTDALMRGIQESEQGFARLEQRIDQNARAADRLEKVYRRVGDQARAAQRKAEIPPTRLEQIRTWRKEQELAGRSVQTTADIQARAGRDPIYAASLARVRDTLAANRRELGLAGRETKDVAAETDRASRSFDRFQGSIAQTARRMTALVAGYVTFRTALRLGRELFDTNRELERLEAQLRTITGGVGPAARSFELIKRFAVETPFQLQELTQSFVRLRGFGVEPTERRLRGLGNISAAFGQDITQLTEAVISGVNGMARPLRRFTVNTSVMGDQLRVSFGGVTKTIPRTTEAVVDFLVEVQEGLPIVNAMEERMRTMDGATSNLTDAVTVFAGKIGKAGLNAEMAELARQMTENIEQGDELAETFGEGLAGGVNLFSQSMAELLPLLKLGAEFLERFRSEGAKRADPIVDRIQQFEQPRRVTDEILDAHRRRADAIKRLAQTDRELASIPEEQRRVLRFLGEDLVKMRDQFDRFVLPPRLQQREGTQQALRLFDLERAKRDAEADIEAAGRIIDTGQKRLRELTEEGVPPFVVEPPDGGAGDKVQDFQRAIERLAQGRREIAALEAALEGTAVEFDATAERAQLLEGVVRDLAGLDLDEAQRAQLERLTAEWLGYEQAVLDSEAAIQRWADALDDATIGDPTTAAFEIDTRNAELAREKLLQDMEEAEKVAGQVGDAFADALASIVTRTDDVADAFRRMADSIIQDLVRIGLQRSIVGPIADALFGSLFSIPAAPADITPPPLPPDPFAGGGPNRQLGGPVMARQPVIVGESGRELFVPAVAGRIDPVVDSRAGGARAGDSHVHFHNSFSFNQIDNRGSRDWAEQQGPMLARVMRRQFRLMGER